MGRRAVWIAAVALLLAAPASASAAGLAPDDHQFPASGTDAGFPAAAIAPNGYAAVAWRETIDSTHYRIDLALRPPGGDWGDTINFPATTVSPSSVRVAVNSAGAVALAWIEAENTTFNGFVTTRPAGGSFTAPEVFAGGNAPNVAIDEAGNVNLLYGIVNSGMANGDYLRVAPAGSSLLGTTAETLASGCGGFSHELAVNAGGDAVGTYGCSGVSFFVRHGATISKSSPFADSGGGCGASTQHFGPRVAIDAAGDPIAIVLRSDRTHDCSGFGIDTAQTTLILATPGGGALVAGPTVAQSQAGSGFGFAIPPDDIASADVGIESGFALVGFTQVDGSSSLLRTRTYPGNGAGAPGAIQTVAGSAGASQLADLTVGSDGRALASWIGFDGGTGLAKAAFKPAGQDFGEPVTVNSGGAPVTGLAAAGAPTGDGLIAYIENNAAPHVLKARGFDASPPVFGDVSIPGAATVGAPVAFSAQASDVWGPVGFAWDFGDGSADGATPSHAFAGPGTPLVTVTARDGAGNSAQRSGSVAVTQPATAAGPPALPLTPLLSGVGLTNKVFRVGARSTALTAAKRKRPPVGTTFRFTLNTAASVTIAIDRAQPGRRSGKRCVKPTKRLAKAKRCTRFVRAGRLTRASRAGQSRVPFSGRLGRKALRRGSYRAVLRASADGLAGPATTLRFKVVR